MPSFGRFASAIAMQRNAQQHLQLVLLRLDVALQDDFVGNIVRGENGLQRQREHRGRSTAKNCGLFMR